MSRFSQYIGDTDIIAHFRVRQLLVAVLMHILLYYLQMNDDDYSDVHVRHGCGLSAANIVAELWLPVHVPWRTVPQLCGDDGERDRSL